MSTVIEQPTAALPECFWVLWQELYDMKELQKPRSAWKSPVLIAIRKMLWRCPEHIPTDEFCEWLVNRLEQAVRSDLAQKIKKGLPPDGWKATIQNLDAWLTRSAANATEDYRKSNIPGHRAKVKYRIVHLARKPTHGSIESASVPPTGADVFDVPAPAHTCSDSNELLFRFFREGLGSPITEQCLEHLRVCASCAGLLQHVVLGLSEFGDRGADQMIQSKYVRLLDELGMRNGARHFLRGVRRLIVADLQRYEPQSHSDREIQAGILKLREGLTVLDRNLELLRTLPRWPRKRNLGIRRGTPEMTFIHTITDTGTLLLLLRRDAEITRHDDCLFLNAPGGLLNLIILEHTLANLASDSWDQVLPAFMRRGFPGNTGSRTLNNPLVIVTRR